MTHYVLFFCTWYACYELQLFLLKTCTNVSIYYLHCVYATISKYICDRWWQRTITTTTAAVAKADKKHHLLFCDACSNLLNYFLLFYRVLLLSSIAVNLFVFKCVSVCRIENSVNLIESHMLFCKLVVVIYME